MNLGRLLDRTGDAALGFAAIGLSSLAFLLVWGRAVNSPTAHNLEQLPVLGWAIGRLRAATNQAYDVNSED